MNQFNTNGSRRAISGINQTQIGDEGAPYLPLEEVVAAEEPALPNIDGDLTGVGDAGDVDLSPWDWYQDEYVESRDDVVDESPQVAELPSSGEWEAPDMDGELYPDHWSQAPPIPDDLPQQSIVSDSSEQPPWPEDEDFGFTFWVTPADDLPQQSIVEDGEPVDFEDEPHGFDVTLPEEAAVSVDQPVVEDASQQPEDADEDFAFFDGVLSDDDLPQQGLVEDGSYQDPEDEPFGFEFPVAIDDIAPDQIPTEDATNQPADPPDEDFAFFDAPLAEDSPQLSIVEDASNQPPFPEDDESYGFANDSPLPNDVQSDQVFVEDGNTREEDIGEEDFGFTFDQAVPEQVVESDQVFVEDSSDQLPEPEGDEPFDFSIDPTPADVGVPPQPPAPPSDITGGWPIYRGRRKKKPQESDSGSVSKDSLTEVDEHVLSADEEIEDARTRFEERKQLRLQERKSRALTEELRKALAEQDALLAKKLVLASQIEIESENDDLELALILAALT